MLDGDRILVNMAATRKRLEFIRKDPRVTLTALDEAGWYTHVSLQGRVVEMNDDPDLTDIDRLSTHYSNEPYSKREGKRISAWIEIDRWHGWGGAAAG